MRNENTYKRWKRIPISNTKATKTTMATFKVITYYNNLKNDKFSISFVYFPSNENGWKPKGFFWEEHWNLKAKGYTI